MICTEPRPEPKQDMTESNKGLAQKQDNKLLEAKKRTRVATKQHMSGSQKRPKPRLKPTQNRKKKERTKAEEMLTKTKTNRTETRRKTSGDKKH